MKKLKMIGVFIFLIGAVQAQANGFIKMEDFKISTIMYSKSAGEALIGGVDTGHMVGAFMTCKVQGIKVESIKSTDLIDCQVLEGSMYDARTSEVVDSINQNFVQTFEELYLHGEQVSVNNVAAVRKVARYGLKTVGAVLGALGLFNGITNLMTISNPTIATPIILITAGTIIFIAAGGIDTTVAEIPSLESQVIEGLKSSVQDGSTKTAETLFSEQEALRFYSLFKRAIVATVTKVTGA